MALFNPFERVAYYQRGVSTALVIRPEPPPRFNAALPNASGENVNKGLDIGENPVNNIKNWSFGDRRQGCEDD
jgi:hypothetical protein